MYIIYFFKNNKPSFEKKFDTLKEAEYYVSMENFDYPYEYRIYDKRNESEIDCGEVEYNQDITNATLNMLFPNDDDDEEINYNDYWRD